MVAGGCFVSLLWYSEEVPRLDGFVLDWTPTLPLPDVVLPTPAAPRNVQTAHQINVASNLGRELDVFHRDVVLHNHITITNSVFFCFLFVKNN